LPAASTLATAGALTEYVMGVVVFSLP
jgi:hypothetical protein